MDLALKRPMPLRSAECCRLLLTIDGNGATLLSSVERNTRLAKRTKDDLLQGTLDMLVLRALQIEPMHGWGITERLEYGSGRALQVGQGSLYPALYRLERQGLIKSEWGITENNRQAR